LGSLFSGLMTRFHMIFFCKKNIRARPYMNEEFLTEIDPKINSINLYLLASIFIYIQIHWLYCRFIRVNFPIHEKDHL